jgi:hypothetical protein
MERKAGGHGEACDLVRTWPADENELIVSRGQRF